jgi:hypothetical protein
LFFFSRLFRICFSRFQGQQTIMARQHNTSTFSAFLAGLITFNPILTFLVLVSISLLSIVAAAWLMMRWFELDSPTVQAAAPQKEHVLQSDAKAETTSSDSRSKKE